MSSRRGEVPREKRVGVRLSVEDQAALESVQQFDLLPRSFSEIIRALIHSEVHRQARALAGQSQTEWDSMARRLTEENMLRERAGMEPTPKPLPPRKFRPEPTRYVKASEYQGRRKTHPGF